MDMRQAAGRRDHRCTTLAQMKGRIGLITTNRVRAVLVVTRGLIVTEGMLAAHRQAAEVADRLG